MHELFELNGASWEALQKSCEIGSSSLEALAKVAQQAGAVIAEAWGIMTESLQEAIDAISRYYNTVGNELETLMKWHTEEYWDFVPARVRHLAFHHPKARVRNKNWNRMWKIQKERMRCK